MLSSEIEYPDEEQESEIITDFEPGMIVGILGDIPVTFTTEDADTETAIEISNPAKEEVALSKNGYVSGKAFSEGIYDFTLKDGSSARIYINTDIYDFLEINSDNPQIKNIAIPEGERIIINGDDVTLSPSVIP